MNSCYIYSPDKRFGRMLFLELEPLFDVVDYYKINVPFDPNSMYIVYAAGNDEIARHIFSSGAKCVLISGDLVNLQTGKNIIAAFERPFSIDEFIQKIAFLSGKTPARSAPGTADKRPPSPRALEYDVSSGEFFLEEKILLLTAKEKQLLKLLFDNRGKAVTNEIIFESVGEKSDRSGNTAAVYISFLRKKTDRDGQPPLIKTVRGVGYKLL